ncbi:hypothetical protein [Shewanella phaeophyticola]|uniref:Uncharacterized protein n=1 Tax=Shewanella phaeophyticola TaxID=2978345 RepID=A0ABT2NZ60_9GAMM|nr:hypothetical protein [Shewanella sp. KJ10-1]MCT8985461.1 hypothetical protein [Shewanella sp. KJ10-1]
MIKPILCAVGLLFGVSVYQTQPHGATMKACIDNLMAQEAN